MARGANGMVEEARLAIDGVNASLARLVELSEARLDEVQMRYERATVQMPGGAGVATLEFQTRPGVEWWIYRAVVQGGTAAGSGFNAYLNEVNTLQLIDYALFDANGIAIRGTNNPQIYVPPRQRLIFQFFTSGGGATTCLVNLLIKEIVAEGAPLL